MNMGIASGTHNPTTDTGTAKHRRQISGGKRHVPKAATTRGSWFDRALGGAARSVWRAVAGLLVACATFLTLPLQAQTLPWDGHTLQDVTTKGPRAIVNSGDVVWYSLPNLKENGVYQFSYSQYAQDRVSRPKLQVYNSSGDPVVHHGRAIAVTGANNSLRFMPDAAGTYYMKVSSLVDGTGRFWINYGNYSLRPSGAGDRNGADCGGGLNTRCRIPAPGHVIEGQLKWGDWDRYDFALRKGKDARVCVTFLSDLPPDTIQYGVSSPTGKWPWLFPEEAGTFCTERFRPKFTGIYQVSVQSLVWVEAIRPPGDLKRNYEVRYELAPFVANAKGTEPVTPTEPLTATLEDFPTNHDGSGAFTFRIAFSADVEITPEDMRDNALMVAGGTVTDATRVDGRSDLWELTVEPAGTGAVSILVPRDRACTETGALCTADGQALSTGLAHSVPGPAPSPQNQQALAPLAAGFVSVPAEHDGETEFWLELSFDAAVVQGSKPHIRALLGVTGGSVTRMRRKDGRLDHWRVRVEPSSHEAVTVTLSPSPACGTTGAVCTQDGRTYTTALVTQIQGPPGLAVADAQMQEAANATLAFAVTLSRAPSGTVTVDYATADGTATAGSDYTATSGTLSFAAGETEKTVSVPVLDDAHDEGSETLTLTLSNPSGAYLEDGTATGTINNSDPMPLAWMVRFGRTVGSQVVDALGERLDSGTASHVTVGGINLTGEPGAMPETQANDPFGLPEWATRTQREASAQSLTANELLLGSAFHLSSGSGQGEGPAYTAWGRVARSGFDAEVDDVTMDGDVTSGLIGFDAEWERVLAGVMLSQSSGEGSYRLSEENGGRTGTVESSLTGVYPYARLELNRHVSAWALAGMGSGDLTLQQEGDKAMPTDITMRMGAVGFKGQVLDGTGPSGLAVNVKSDAMWVGTQSERTADMVGTQGDVTRLRVIVEGERAFDMGGGASFTPSAEVGLRHDAGDAETGTGLEMGVGVSYAAGPLTVEGQVRMLAAHEESGYEEWGASGAMRITPSASGRGLTLSIAPEWGRTGSAAERLWSARDASGLGADDEFEADSRIAIDAGYGFGLAHGQGVVTPYAGLTLGDAGSRTVRTGMRWQVTPDAVFGLEATRQTSDAGEGANEVRLRAALRF